MRIVTAGVSGFIGSQLLPALRAAGHQVQTLVRRTASGPDEISWDPDSGRLGNAVLDGADAVINLCGVGVGDRRWTPAYQELIRTSRVHPTELLAQGCAVAGVPVLLNASAVGIYGDGGDQPVDETSPPGSSFLAGVCVDWEAATEAARSGGVRVVNLRSGLVLGRAGGLLPRLALMTKLLVGGRLGSGQQYFPWISIADEVRAIGFLLSADVRGPVNLVAPTPVTNAEFTAALGSVLRRPTPWVVPAFALKAALGGFAVEVLGGQRAVPAALTSADFDFSHRELAGALHAELSHEF